MPDSSSENKFSQPFYFANTMEIFERLAWYGFFTLSSLYMTSPKIQGGLGFSDQERGFLQGMIPFLLYIFPVITGALADRYGYRRMFIISFAIMTPSYYLLGQVTSFWAFCGVFFAVAVGAACFKPVVVGTIAKVTNDKNRGLGFGIFYTMVNIGGFLGPLIAGYVRVIGWDMVFIMSSLWIAINFIPAIFFFKEPQSDSKQNSKSVNDVLVEARSVLGNGRLALLIIPMLIAFMVSAKGVFSYTDLMIGCVVWLTLNLLWDKIWCLPAAIPSAPHAELNLSTNLTTDTNAHWFTQPIKLGNKSFMVYLLILTGFWTMYLQLFITTPLYIRDFVNTSDLVGFLQAYLPSWLPFLAGVNIEQLTQFIITQSSNIISEDAANLSQVYFELVNYKVMVPISEIQSGLQQVSANALTSQELAVKWRDAYRQVNPEYIVNLDFGAIVLCQIFISRWCNRLDALPVIVVGTIVVALGFFIGGMAHGLLLGGTVIVTSIIVFAVGEMIASPKSQEYVASIAPKENCAMYMGYYFVSMALGNLFAGILSGWAYAELAKGQNNPTLMWFLFGGIGLVTAIFLVIFSKYWLPKWRLEQK